MRTLRKGETRVVRAGERVSVGCDGLVCFVAAVIYRYHLEYSAAQRRHDGKP